MGGYRLLGVVLLVLAVSPVTAPFSACDLAALFGAPAGQGYTAPGHKSSADHCPAAAGDAVAPAADRRGFLRTAACPLRLLRVRGDLLLQLRI